MTMETVNTESVFVIGAASKAMPFLMRRPFATDVSLNDFNKTLSLIRSPHNTILLLTKL
jgi:hypothetical protein